MNITIDIEKLILHGFEPGQRHEIGAAVEQELTRLAAASGWTAPQSQHSERSQQFEIAANAPAALIGMQIARAIYGQCGGSREEGA